MCVQPFGVKMLYYARRDKPAMAELGVERVTVLEEFVSRCDVVSINLPPTDKTKGMFGKDVISKMKKVRRKCVMHRSCSLIVCCCVVVLGGIRMSHSCVLCLACKRSSSGPPGLTA